VLAEISQAFFRRVSKITSRATIRLGRSRRPGYRTIAKFRRDNWASLKAVNRQFVPMMRELGLVGGAVVAIDGAIPAFAGTSFARLEESGQTQLSHTDADARLLSKNGQVVAGYNVQIAVDDKHKLIVASEVVNGNDSGQLHAMAKAAKDELGVATLTALADGGYYNGNTLKACEEDGIVAYVPPPQRSERLAAQGRLSHEAFIYDTTGDAYRCPGGALLTPSERRKLNAGRIEIRYTSRKADCDACPLRARCLSARTPTCSIQRWEHEAVLERHRTRMEDAADRMRRRAALAEHPFGTLKCRAGYRHFLVRGFDKVRGEWSLMALCYNFSRALAILGLDRLIAAVAGRAGKSMLPLLGARAAACDAKQRCWLTFEDGLPIIRSTNPSPGFAR
jgi:hypothetical protein